MHLEETGAGLAFRRERWVACGLAALAAIRVLLFAAAFPFFTTVDEHMHVDAVLKYARGYLPRPVTDDYEPEMATWFGIYGTPEYHHRGDPSSTAGVEPPVWRRSPAAAVAQIEATRARFERLRNLEAYQPPVYYAAAAGWLELGRRLGLEGGNLLYWLRGLNAVAFFALVLSSYFFLRGEYPGNPLVRLGVPILLTVFPQDALYYVTPDALSPLLFAAGFFLALHVARGPRCTAVTCAAAGLVTAAAVLSKYTNAALLVPCACCTLIALLSRPEARSLRREGGGLLALWALVVLPIAVWSVRNQQLFGDPTATQAKLERMGWKVKSFAEYGHHPLFTASGPLDFLANLVPAFWRGELVWHRIELACQGVDLFYTVSSIVFVLLCAWGLLPRSDRERARRVEGMGLLALFTCVGLLAGLSLIFAFPRLGNPSSTLPYFAQGRLISGVLVPFLVLYLRGIQVAASLLPPGARARTAWSLVAVVVAAVVVSEIALSSKIFLSEYNWYHLP